MARKDRTQGAVTGIRSTRAKLAYDIRKQVQDSELDAEAIQCIYDDINRMVMLIGDVPFRWLFATPIAQLVPELLRRTKELQQYGLLENAVRVSELGKALIEHAGELTVGDLYAGSRRTISKEVQAILVGLRREGIRIPLPNGGGEEAKTRAQVVERLVGAAPELNFKQYYTAARRDHRPAVRDALAFARLHALLGWGVNDRCCDHDRFTKLDYCRPKEGSWCALADDPKPSEHGGVLYGFCTDSSNKC